MTCWPWRSWTAGKKKTEPVNLEEVAREMLTLAEKEAAKKNLRLVLEVAPTVEDPGGQGLGGTTAGRTGRIVAAGYSHLAQVALNLLENVVRYSPPSGRVLMRLG